MFLSEALGARKGFLEYLQPCYGHGALEKVPEKVAEAGVEPARGFPPIGF
jgi:hypothetical protein